MDTFVASGELNEPIPHAISPTSIDRMAKGWLGRTLKPLTSAAGPSSPRHQRAAAYHPTRQRLAASPRAVRLIAHLVSIARARDLRLSCQWHRNPLVQGRPARHAARQCTDNRETLTVWLKSHANGCRQFSPSSRIRLYERYTRTEMGTPLSQVGNLRSILPAIK